MLSPVDSNSNSLVQKILSSPLTISEMKKFIKNPEKSCIVTNVSSIYELELARELKCTFLGFDPKYSKFGTKNGSKDIFKIANLPFPDSTKLCKVESLFYEETLDLIQRNPLAKRLVVKLNDSFSGKGNAVMDLDNFKKFLNIKPLNRSCILDQLKLECQQMVFDHSSNWTLFCDRINDMGIISEIFIDCISCPSGQGYVEKGKIMMVSTHDQILDDEIYIGCRFPCDAKFRKKVNEYTKKVGEVFESLEIYGNFGVDYLATSHDELYALEINLRITGTTHPNMTMRLLIKGEYDEDSGFFVSKSGLKKFYVASDNIVDDAFKKFTSKDIIDILESSEYRFDSEKELGVVLHLVGAVAQHGKFGLTCIHNSIEEATSMYEKVLRMFKDLSKSLK